MKKLLLAALVLYGFATRRERKDIELKLPEGFRAETVVESLGRNRHIAVNNNGDIYI
jgi:hypothetical protein